VGDLGLVEGDKTAIALNDLKWGGGGVLARNINR